MPEECFECPFYVQEPHDGEGCPACDVKAIFDVHRAVDNTIYLDYV